MNKKRFQDISSTFANKSILVVGDIMLDSFMWGVADRISPEAPVPIVSVELAELASGVSTPVPTKDENNLISDIVNEYPAVSYVVVFPK